MTAEIRPVPAGDLRGWLETIEAASGDELSDEAWPYLEKVFEPDRVLGAYDGSTIVGGGAAYSFALTVPGGGEVRAAGVTAVGVLPTHRRQGILRALMARQLRDMRERGEQAAILWASEGSIYQRFGYGLATLNGRLDMERDRAVFNSLEPPAGTTRMVDRDGALKLMPPVYDAVRAVTPGFFSRSRTWWQNEVLSDLHAYRRGAGKKFYVVHERDGRPAGYVMYRVASEWGDVGTLSVLHVQELVALDDRALRETWRFVFGHDLIHRIRARVGPPDNPLLLMVTEPRRLGMRLVDGLWLRLVDVPASLAARAFAADDSLVLEVADAFVPEFGGRWRLSTSGGQATAVPTDEAPDIALTTGDLAVTYLGAFTFEHLARAGRAAELTPGARARADAMFATTTRPWCAQVF